MARSKQIIPILLAFLSLLSLSLAASSTSFCKCSCFGNSTIIALSGSKDTSSSSTATHFNAESDASKAHRGTCADCNRKFCLDYNLPICKGAKEEDVNTSCFRRDSAKDEAVVFIFIFATVGLLVYAAVRPWVEDWAEKMRERRSYMPISSAGAAGDSAGADES